MRLCGCEVGPTEIRVAICYRNNGGAITLYGIEQTRIEIKDDLDDKQLQACKEEIERFADQHNVSRFIVKARPRKGRMAGSPGSFKLEALLQLNETTETVFVAGQTLAAFAKKDFERYPKGLPVFLKGAFLAGAWALSQEA